MMEKVKRIPREGGEGTAVQAVLFPAPPGGIQGFILLKIQASNPLHCGSDN